MSKIQKALVAIAVSCVASFKPESYKDRGELRVAIVKAANDMSDDDWAGLSTEAQDWFNDAADAVKAKKVPAEFPDYKEEEAEEQPRSRRRGADPEPEPETKGGSTTAVEDLEEGQNVAITYKKRGGEKVAKGEIVEYSKRKGFLVVKDADGEEHEIDFDTVTATEVFHGDAGGDTPEAEAVLGVGAEIAFQTKRGKDVSGTVKELNEKEGYFVLENGDDYDLDKVVDLKVVKGAPTAKEEKPAGRSRSSAPSEDKGADKGGKDAGGDKGGDDKPKRSSNPKGVSVGARIRDLLAEDPDRSVESIEKALKKDEIEFRPATLEMIFKDSVYLIGKLRDEGHMKKAK